MYLPLMKEPSNRLSYEHAAEVSIDRSSITTHSHQAAHIEVHHALAGLPYSAHCVDGEDGRVVLEEDSEHLAPISSGFSAVASALTSSCPGPGPGVSAEHLGRPDLPVAPRLGEVECILLTGHGDSDV